MAFFAMIKALFLSFSLGGGKPPRKKIKPAPTYHHCDLYKNNKKAITCEAEFNRTAKIRPCGRTIFGVVLFCVKRRQNLDC